MSDSQPSHPQKASHSSKPLREIFGFIYAATGEAFVQEAVQSAQSVRRCMPNVGIAISTDRPEQVEPLELFDEIHTIQPDGSRFGIKYTGMLNSPFEKSVFMDTDTYMIGPAYELIPLLDEFDIAAAHEPERCNDAVTDVPVSFPEYNTGVIAYRSTPEILQLLRDIQQTYYELDKQAAENPNPQVSHPTMVGDQAAFRKLLYTAKIRQYVLPPEYNLRAYAPYFASSPVRILHCRGKALRRAIARANYIPRIRTGAGFTWIEQIAFDLKQEIKRIAPSRFVKTRPKSWEHFEARNLDVSHYRDHP